MELRRWVRSVVVGRPDGLRATIRRQTGWFTWLDDDASVDVPVPAGNVRGPGPTSPAEGWVDVLAFDELAEGVPAEVFVEGEGAVLVRVASEVYALDGVCAHAGGPLGEGSVDGHTLTCPWHGWTYDVRTGTTPMREQTCLRQYQVRVDSGRVLLRL